MGYIKYANDKRKLAAFIHDNPRMIIERNAAMVISTATRTTINIPDKAAGLLEGKSAGLIEGQFQSLAALVKDGLLDINEAAKRANMSVEEFEEKMYQISK